LVLRIYEAFNKRGKATLKLWRAPSAVRSTDILEGGDVPREISTSGSTVEFSYRNYEIVTLKISL